MAEEEAAPLPRFAMTIYSEVVDDVTHADAARMMVDAIRDGIPLDVIVLRDGEDQTQTITVAGIGRHAPPDE